MTAERDFLAMALENPAIATILNRAPILGLPDWWLTGGAVFQTVWNRLEGRDAQRGILDYDLFYHDPDDLSAESEAAAGAAAASLFADLPASVDVRNEARVHLWYEAEFGVPGRPFESTRDAIDHFAAITCCHALTRGHDGRVTAYAPHGYDDLLGRRVRANPVLVPRDVYERKARRWGAEWPSLTVEPWPDAPEVSTGPTP